MQWKVVFAFLAAVLAVGFGGLLVGGYRDTDPNNPEVQSALNFAMAKHNQDSNDMYLSQVAEVVKAETQVVAGTNYRITVKLARSTCRKQSSNEVCVTQTDPALARTYECTFTVWSRPWMSDIRLTKHQC